MLHSEKKKQRLQEPRDDAQGAAQRNERLSSSMLAGGQSKPPT